MDITKVASVKVMDGGTTLAEFTDQDKFFRYLADGPRFTNIVVTFKDGTEQTLDVATVNAMIKHYFPDGITNTIEAGGRKPRP